MPFSWNDCDNEFAQDIKEIIKPTTCFDIGTGYGKTGTIIKKDFPDCEIVGFEIYEKYLKEKEEELKKLYSEIKNIDFYEWIQKNVKWRTDLIVFGDVLEHFMKSKVFDILDMCKYRCKWMAIKVPIDLRQNIYEDNMNEAHISTITLHDLYLYNIAHYVKKDRIEYFLIKGLYPPEKETTPIFP